MLVLVCVSTVMLVAAQSAKADDLKYQELVRAMPPRAKSYPILDSLERELYPNQDFHKEDPGHRLERLEIAMLGTRQSGTIAERLDRLRSEIANWQIAQSAPVHRPSQVQLHARADDIPPQELYALKAQDRQLANNERLRYSKFLMDDRAKERYENNVVRVANPIVQRLGKRTVDAMFGVKQN